MLDIEKLNEEVLLGDLHFIKFTGHSALIVVIIFLRLHVVAPLHRHAEAEAHREGKGLALLSGSLNNQTGTSNHKEDLITETSRYDILIFYCIIYCFSISFCVFFYYLVMQLECHLLHTP